MAAGCRRQRTCSYPPLSPHSCTLTRSAPPGARARDIHRFISPREVEIVARCCRVWIDVDTLNPDSVALAERVLKVRPRPQVLSSCGGFLCSVEQAEVLAAYTCRPICPL